LLRSIGYQFDDHITVRLITMLYEYLLLDPEVPDDEKGDFDINAHGSAALVERSIQDAALASMAPLVVNPIFGGDPKKYFALLLKSKKINPTELQYSPAEQAKIDNVPKPQPPAIEVANIRAKMDGAKLQAEQQQKQAELALEKELAQLDAQTRLEAAKLQATTSELKARLDTDRDTQFVQAETVRAQTDYAAKMAELTVKKELAVMEYAAKHQMSLEQVRADLASTAMQLRTQKELAANQHAMDLHQHHTPSAESLLEPVVQTPGRAGNGKAASQVSA
jgi:hypothetical protein